MIRAVIFLSLAVLIASHYFGRKVVFGTLRGLVVKPTKASLTLTLLPLIPLLILCDGTSGTETREPGVYQMYEVPRGSEPVPGLSKKVGTPFTVGSRESQLQFRGRWFDTWASLSCFFVLLAAWQAFLLFLFPFIRLYVDPTYWKR